ncbi:MAG: hypothetical protein AAFV26_00055 [Pseudomonadota bacterium]
MTNLSIDAVTCADLEKAPPHRSAEIITCQPLAQERPPAPSGRSTRPAKPDIRTDTN